ncbi:DUF3592 domain-containing protein [Woeseia oceani]|nr:DUF3592 domain-containing protein [Woeseia oceani]
MNYKKRSMADYLMLQQSWVYAILIVAGLGLAAIKMSSYSTFSRVSVEGVEAVGLVTNKSEQRSGRDNKGKTYRLSYSFETADGSYIQGIQSVTEAFFDAQAVDGEIAVLYLPSDPQTNFVEPSKLTKGFWVAVFASIGLILGGIAGGFFAVSRARECISLRETGEVRTATVTSHEIEGQKKEKGHMVWRDESGDEGRSLVSPLEKLLPVGASITVFADRQGHLKSVWEGDIGSR